MTVTYSSYLRINELLRLQQPESDPEEHDEMLFIVIHQVYELWFKLMLHEFEKVRRDLRFDDLFGAIATFKRVRTVMKTLVSQLDILETMTPMSFSSFRDRLETASGFQSAQFRELEFLLGLKREEMLKHYEYDGPALARLRRRLVEDSIVDAFYLFLEQRGATIPEDLKQRDRRLPTTSSESVQRSLIELYKSRNEIGILFELMTDLDEGLQEWRYRHVKMVERTIGHKRGTGGSPGVDFLKTTLFKPIFPDLWTIRSEL